MSENTEVAIEKVVAPEPEVVIDDVADDSTRVYRARTVLTYLDTDLFDLAQAHIETKSPTPVFNSDHKEIGFASVNYDEAGKRLVADITIEYGTEERLLAETDDHLYARYFGILALGALPVIDLQRPLTVVRLRVDGILLTTVKPEDPRLLPFGAKVF